MDRELEELINNSSNLFDDDQFIKLSELVVSGKCQNQAYAQVLSKLLAHHNSQIDQLSDLISEDNQMTVDQNINNPNNNQLKLKNEEIKKLKDQIKSLELNVKLKEDQIEEMKKLRESLEEKDKLISKLEKERVDNLAKRIQFYEYLTLLLNNIKKDLKIEEELKFKSTRFRYKIIFKSRIINFEIARKSKSNKK